MPDGTQPQLESNIEPIEIQEEMERSFLDYAMSVITSRALPDARDGLKPVQRRILYGMYEGGLRPERNYKKSASAVGDVMGKYHPHGDQSIYDALARMAQDFSLRYPLVDGHGNFGSPDPNDRPAAMRYCVVGVTRCRQRDGHTADRRDRRRRAELRDADRPEGARSRRAIRCGRRGSSTSGDHPTLRLRTREGYELTGTRNHPVLCLERARGRAGAPVEAARGDRARATVVDRRAQARRTVDRHTDGRASDRVPRGRDGGGGLGLVRRAGFNNVDADVLRGRGRGVGHAWSGGRRYVNERLLASGSQIHELDVHHTDASRGVAAWPSSWA